MFEFAVVRRTVCTFRGTRAGYVWDAALRAITGAKAGDGQAIVRAATSGEAVQAYMAATGERPREVASDHGKVVGYIEIVALADFKEVQPW